MAFGFSKSPEQQRRDEEARILAQWVEHCNKYFQLMVVASPEDTERLGRELHGTLRSATGLPDEFRKTAVRRIREFERDSYMRAADKVLREALSLTAEGDMLVRARKLGEAEAYAAKAVEMGAEEKFKMIIDRWVENTRIADQNRRQDKEGALAKRPRP